MAVIPQGGTTGTSTEVELNSRAVRSMPRNNDWQLLGSYSIASPVAAGVFNGNQTNASFWQLRTAGPGTFPHLVAVRKLLFSISANQGSLAPFVFQLFIVRNATANGSGGTATTFTGANGKLRTPMAPTLISDIRITAATVTAMTGQQDAMPIASATFPCGPVNIANTQVVFPLFEARAGEYPILLGANEGLNLQITNPASNPSVSITCAFDELVAY